MNTNSTFTAFGAEITRYNEYCGNNADNEVTGKAMAFICVSDLNRRYVSPEMVHEALLNVNPGLFFLDGAPDFADNAELDSVFSHVNRQLRGNARYTAELSSFEQQGRVAALAGSVVYI